jgi:muconate cycloisomerase
MLSDVREAAPSSVVLRVDANGGWNLDDARRMIAWLADRNVEFVEQPLALGQEEDLPALYENSPLPIFADESCRVSADIPRLADRVHGINLKLMKSGGIREGLRAIHTARACGLKVMMGCMSESSLAIAASAHISAFADYLDLDSHLNLNPDPCAGLTIEDGRVLPGPLPGLGISIPD